MEKRFEKIFLISFAIFAVGLGFWGYAIAGSDYVGGACLHHVAPPPCPNPARPFTALEALHCLIAAVGLLRLYDLFQPGIDPWQLVVAQILVPGIAVFSAGQLFLTGVRKNLRTAMASRKSNHSIVCGIGDVGMQIVQNLRAANHMIVAVDLQGDSANAATCEKAGVAVLQGDAKSSHVLLAAGIRRAQTAIVCTGSDSENMDVALQINAIHAELPQRRGDEIQVLAELRNDWMHKRLVTSDKRSLGSAHVDLRLFNSFNAAARMLIKRIHLPPGPEFEARTFVLVGFGAYGREIALHLIRSSPVAFGEKLKIVVFDQNADAARQRFLNTDPAAAEKASIEFIAASVVPGSCDLARVIEPALESAGPLLGIALALGDDEMSLCAALEMRSLLDRNGHVHVPVYVRLEHYLRLGEVVRSIEDLSAFRDRLQSFGTLEETLSADVLLGFRLDTFAQALHEDYRQRSQDSINPQANVPWRELPEFMKMSNRWRADHTPLLMELAGLHLEPGVSSPSVLPLSEKQIELLARLERRRYTIERSLIERRFGSAQGQSMPDWDGLTEDQKDSERREVARLPEIMARLGIQLHPVRQVRFYGNWLTSSNAEIEQLLAVPGSSHCILIVDLDEAAAVTSAARALSLPLFSLWLFSKDEPPEFWLRKPQGQPPDRARLIQRANGWSFRSRILLDQ